MAQVDQERAFEVDADEMWKTIGDFTDLGKWSSGLGSIDIEDGGKTRRINLPGGALVVEHLLEEGDRSYTYSLDDGGALPVKNYRSTLGVTEQGAGRCKVTWSGTFDPADGTAEEQAVQIINMVYSGGLDGIAKKFS
jgi:hypothetical protein